MIKNNRTKNEIKWRNFMMKNNKKQEIPVFFATDDNYVPYLVVSIRSLIDKCSSNNKYSIYVLNTGLTEQNKKAYNFPLGKSYTFIVYIIRTLF